MFQKHLWLEADESNVKKSHIREVVVWHVLSWFQLKNTSDLDLTGYTKPGDDRDRERYLSFGKIDGWADINYYLNVCIDVESYGFRKNNL